MSLHELPNLIQGTDEQPWRPDAPRAGTFANFRDAVAEASFRAALGGRRHRVTYEPNNCWWQITEGFRLGTSEDRGRPRRMSSRSSTEGPA